MKTLYANLCFCFTENICLVGHNGAYSFSAKNACGKMISKLPRNWFAKMLSMLVNS